MIFHHWACGELIFLPLTFPSPPPAVCCFSHLQLFPSLTSLTLVSHNVLWFYFVDTVFLELVLRLQNLLGGQLQYCISNSSLFFCLLLYPNPCLIIVRVVTCLTPVDVSPSDSGCVPRHQPGCKSPSVCQFRPSLRLICCPTFSPLVAWCSLGVLHISCHKYYGFWQIVTLLNNLFPKFDKELPEGKGCTLLIFEKSTTFYKVLR